MKQHPIYHSFLRVSALVCAIALVFESGILSESTAQLSNNTHRYLANAIGMSAAVQPTELNKYTAALTAKERELQAREASLNEREISVSLSSGDGNSSDKVTYVLASILFILLALILLNYALDYLRARDRQTSLPV